MNTKYLHRWLAALVVATLAALAWNHFGMESVLRLDASASFPLHVIDDRSNGGKSVSTLRRDGGALVLECDIRPGYQWPYCEISVELGRAPAGRDLSVYDTVVLNVRSEGPEPKQQLRLFMLNFNPAYSKVGAHGSSKVVELQFDPNDAAGAEVNLSPFTVASWWTNEHATPARYAGPEFTNVTAVQLSTGGNVQPGRHRIIVESIEFRGKLVSPAAMRLGIIAMWLAAVIGYLLAYALRTRQELLASRRSNLSLARLNEALRLESSSFQRLARHDPLTGVLNRQGLGEEIMRLGQQGDAKLFPLSLVFIDIDHFKRINDQLGHHIGDEVLKDVAALVRQHIQRDDLFARWGGEEFLLICPMTSADEARAVAERLRQLLAQATWSSGLRVTASFGVAQWLPGEELASSIRRADEAMYRAKATGRDRVELQLVRKDEEELAA